ncbi:Cysteine-rich secretory protein family protein [Nonomuraea solani]|uniref:Cysteine-rich secretory protein family protein n=1 Tax=Nonomuraea solani TaxID=1144553 RepID=A0A1H6EQ67_9ACTN|nr:CAP family protein [Nonomuraea solani]SEH00020.1 Cysteine-rich secretory protein family protein [Nonomuraea solani]
MPGTRPPLPDSTTPEFQAEALAEANAYRAKHHAPPLTMDPELNAYAKERAASRSEQEALDAGHTGLRAQTGENIFWGGGSEALPGSMAVKNWYDEIGSYDFAAAKFSPNAGHFTQLVWKSSTKVGIGRAAGQGGEFFETYIVFVFEQRGNMQGAFAENVLPA